MAQAFERVSPDDGRFEPDLYSPDASTIAALTAFVEHMVVALEEQIGSDRALHPAVLNVLKLGPTTAGLPQMVSTRIGLLADRADAVAEERRLLHLSEIDRRLAI